MCREEFRFRNFKLWHPVLSDFTNSRFLSLPVFTTIRLIVTIYNLAWFIYNIYKYKAKLFIYLTNWNYTVLNLYFVMASTLSCIALCRLFKKRKDVHSANMAKDGPNAVEIDMGPSDARERGPTAREEDALRLHHKLLWILHILASNVGLVVTAAYWGVLHDDDEPIDGSNITKHALNSVFMLVDTFLSAIPVRLFHSFYPLLFMLIYLLFTVVYWILDGTNSDGRPYIYALLDYDNFEASTGCLIAFFLLLVQPILHLLLFGLTKLRDHLSQKVCKPNNYKQDRRRPKSRRSNLFQAVRW